MSHFSVLVVLDKFSNEELEKALQPFHEYECTGIEDEYVVDVDVTDEVMEHWNNDTVAILTLPDGEIVHRYDERFYTGPKEYKYDSHGGFVMPEGGVEGTMPLFEYTEKVLGETLEDWAKGYGNWDKRGERFYNRTNPSAQWDWWVIGGRFRGKLITKPLPQEKPLGGELGVFEMLNGAEEVVGHDVVLWGDIDLAAMKKKAESERADWIKEIWEKSGLGQLEIERGIRAEATAKKRWQDLPEPRPRGGDFTDWMVANIPDGDMAAKVSKDQWSLPEIGDMSITEWINDAPPFSSFAVLKDGHWAQCGEMGWWACVSNENSNWDKDFQAILNTIRPDQWVVIVDCHI